VNGLFVEEVGTGPRVLLVHGSGDRETTWADQRGLADQFRLVIPDRRGYGESPACDPSFDNDAADIATLMEAGSHLVGFSYGGIGCLLAAAKRPDAVLSLTVIEPVAFALASEHPAVATMVSRLKALSQAAPELSAEEFDARFDAALGAQATPAEIPKLDGATRGVVETIMRERPAWEATIPCDALAAASFPRLVVSGGWSPAFEAICDELQARIGGEREVRADYGGHGVQHAAGFNDLLTAVVRRS
jgi:pimeloyl-ACP methyl ester carboxylesterase